MNISTETEDLFAVYLRSDNNRTGQSPKDSIQYKKLKEMGVHPEFDKKILSFSSPVEIKNNGAFLYCAERFAFHNKPLPGFIASSLVKNQCLSWQELKNFLPFFHEVFCLRQALERKDADLTFKFPEDLGWLHRIPLNNLEKNSSLEVKTYLGLLKSLPDSLTSLQKDMLPAALQRVFLGHENFSEDWVKKAFSLALAEDILPVLSNVVDRFCSYPTLAPEIKKYWQKYPNAFKKDANDFWLKDCFFSYDENNQKEILKAWGHMKAPYLSCSAQKLNDLINNYFDNFFIENLSDWGEGRDWSLPEQLKGVIDVCLQGNNLSARFGSDQIVKVKDAKNIETSFFLDFNEEFIEIFSKLYKIMNSRQQLQKKLKTRSSPSRSKKM